MVDRGPSTLQPPPVVPPVPLVPLVQLQVPPEPNQPVPMPQLNWSHFKPEFSGKPEEDAEVHLLRTNNQMDMHTIPDGVKVQRFSLTLVDEVRLWYELLRPIAVNWDGLQDKLRQQFSKLGNTREQLFHAWRSFHYDENTETLDTYAMQIRQVAALLGYGEPQILEVFKNTLPDRLYWVLFPIAGWRLAVEMEKNNPHKGEDRQTTSRSVNLSISFYEGKWQ